MYIQIIIYVSLARAHVKAVDLHIAVAAAVIDVRRNYFFDRLLARAPDRYLPLSIHIYTVYSVAFVYCRRACASELITSSLRRVIYRIYIIICTTRNVYFLLCARLRRKRETETAGMGRSGRERVREKYNEKLMKKKRRARRRIFAYDNNRIGPPGRATRFINRYCSVRAANAYYVCVVRAYRYTRIVRTFSVSPVQQS